MAVIRNNLGWKAKDFKGMYFEEVKAKIKTVWEQIESGVSKISEGEAAWLKRKGMRSEEESAKKQKISEEVPKELKSSVEVPEEKIKEMMQLVPIEEVYVEALQVKHPIIDWKAFPLPAVKFPLPEELSTASEDGSHYQKKRDATSRKITLLSMSRRNCQSKMAVTLKELPTTSEDGSHCQKKRDATARKIALLSMSKRNCQSK
nr:hypothetical protein [Tanacetum cinerariifolium]